MMRALEELTYALTLCAALAGSWGCSSVPGHRKDEPIPPHSLVSSAVPGELCKTLLPTYTIAPPDILEIDAVRVVPKSPYYLQTFDVLAVEVMRSENDMFQPGDVIQITVPGAIPTAPINGLFVIESNGAVNLGYNYGAVRVAGLNREQARAEIVNHLAAILKNPAATVFLAQAGEPIKGNFMIQIGGIINFGSSYGAVRIAGLTLAESQVVIQRHLCQFFVNPRIIVSIAETGAQQQIAGQHLVNPDGTVTLGTYGSVQVTGLTLAQAKMVIEDHLTQFIEPTQIAVSVYSYNSKVYYLITQGGGMGDGVYRFPITGNDTVLDAVAQINGLEPVSSKKIWIARPNPCSDEPQILEVDWHGITAMAQTGTNYQILPGDRVFVAEDKLIALDSALAKLISPVERVMGFAVLGTATATRLSGPVLKGGGDQRVRGF